MTGSSLPGNGQGAFSDALYFLRFSEINVPPPAPSVFCSGPALLERETVRPRSDRFNHNLMY